MAIGEKANYRVKIIPGNLLDFYYKGLQIKERPSYLLVAFTIL